MRYLEGVSLTAVGRGTGRMLAPMKARHADAKAEHAAELADWRKLRADARKLKDPGEREAALQALGDRPKGPTHPALVAIGCAVVGAVVLWPVTRGHHGVILAVGFTVWAVAALIAGNMPDGEKKDEKPADDAGEESAPAGPTPAEVHALTASLTAGGDHVLLTRLAAALGAAHPGWEPSTKAVRALLAEADIPIRAGVRTAAGNGPGVHHSDVPALPSPTDAAPLEGVVANVGAGQTPTPTPTTPGRADGGKGFVSVPDPDHPDRTIIVYEDAAA